MKVTLNRYSLGLGVSIAGLLLAGLLFVAAQSGFFLIPYPVVTPSESLPMAETPRPTSGQVFVEYINTNQHTEADNGLRMKLKLRDQEGRLFDLFAFSNETGMHYPALAFTLHDGALYFIEGRGQIKKMDAELKSASAVTTGIAPGEFASDYLFVGDTLYTLAGVPCTFYMGKCDNTLRSVSLSTGTVREIAANISFHDVGGLDAARENLFVIQEFGDAGCFSTRIGKINLASGAFTELERFGACAGDGGEADAEYEREHAAKDAFLKSLEPARPLVEHLQLSDGKLLVPTETSESKYNYFNIRVN